MRDITLLADIAESAINIYRILDEKFDEIYKSLLLNHWQLLWHTCYKVYLQMHLVRREHWQNESGIT
jgi:hypothetical protein